MKKTMNPEAVVERQILAYNSKDIVLFASQYADDVIEYRPPLVEPFLKGKAAFVEYYSSTRFVLPNLHADIVHRMTVGNKVVDHERIAGITDEVLEGIAVYEVIGETIKTVWFFSDE